MKKLLTFAFVIATATMAQAAYLYWQTSDASTFNGHEITGYNLYANGTQITSGVTDAAGEAVEVPLVGGYQYVIDVTKYADTSSFYIEVLGYDAAKFGQGVQGVIGVGETVNYQSLLASNSILVGGTALNVPTYWGGGAVSAPEPTSGLLMLFGLAGLALKRRKI